MIDQWATQLGTTPAMLGAGFAGVLLLVVAAGWIVGTVGWGARATERESKRADRARAMSKAWAGVGDLGVLRLTEPDPSRLRLGLLGNTVVAAPPRRSVLVIAPTGAGKTPRVAVPQVLRHRGPAVVASVKADILHLTRHHRGTQGPVWVLDITGASGLESCHWSPLAGIETFADAMKAASWLSAAAKTDSKGIEDQQFWGTLGEKLLAPLLFAAAKTGRHISAVSRWVDLATEEDVRAILAEIGDLDAMAAWEATCARVDRTKASVFGTAEVVLAPFAHPEVRDTLNVAPGTPRVFTPADLIDQGGTLYLVAPASDQKLFTPIFETVTNAVLREVERRSARNAGLPLNPPLFVCLDEAANVAPLRDLDTVASAGANQGIVLASFWQDEGQIQKVYGRDRARTVMSNHTVRLILPGVSDDETLKKLSEAIGDHRVRDLTTSRDASSISPGRKSSSSTRWTDERLAPVDWLRRLPVGTAIALTGSTKPMRLNVPGWWEDPEVATLVDDDVRAQYNAMFGSSTPAPAGRR